jgi:hypothetical protein
MSIVEILKKNSPDYKHELLWVDFKKNFNSFKDKYKLDLDLDDQSKMLNELQEKKNYKLIAKIIENNLVCYAKLTIKYNDMFNKLLCYKHMKMLNKITNDVDNDFLELMEKLNLIKTIN